MTRPRNERADKYQHVCRTCGQDFMAPHRHDAPCPCGSMDTRRDWKTAPVPVFHPTKGSTK